MAELRPDPSDGARRRGRPTKIGPTQREVAVALVSAGLPRAAAARYLGVSPQTLANASARDRAFGRRLDVAATTQELRHFLAVERASARSWRASAWALERLDRARRSAQKERRKRLAARRLLLERVAAALDEGVSDPPARALLLERLGEVIDEAFAGLEREGPSPG